MITVLVIVAYLTNGTPLPNFFVIPADHPCNNEVALDYTQRFIVPSLGNGAAIQTPEEAMVFVCLPVPAGPGPGPAMRHIPTEDEA